MIFQVLTPCTVRGIHFSAVEQWTGLTISARSLPYGTIRTQRLKFWKVTIAKADAEQGSGPDRNLEVDFSMIRDRIAGQYR